MPSGEWGQASHSPAPKDQPISQVLGYLNFSSGSSDPQFLCNLSRLFREVAGTDEQPRWAKILQQLKLTLIQLEAESSTFADATQARRMLGLLSQLPQAYFTFHQDLLAHQSQDQVINAFFWGRSAEQLLAGLTETDDQLVIDGAIRRLNDYVGYRPVATLESQKIEPYPHEWIRPIPLYIVGAGTTASPYEVLIAQSLTILRQTDPTLLRQAYFSVEHLDELALDPRAYDFDHPANKRPNHHFGQWDLHLIDGDGFYRRYVMPQVTMDALLKRVHEVTDLPRDELMMEASSVLAGTILMASGICGYGPETHDSTVSLATLVTHIAQYRDTYYEKLLDRLDGHHGARLREEAQRMKQPFAAARQDLNRQLTERRAAQLQRVQLAKIYARMGYTTAANEQTSRIQVPSARIACELDCVLYRADVELSEGNPAFALESLEQARRTLLRGIACGAVVDPWNILGFDGNFSLFGSLENSLRDHRVDDLLSFVQEMLEFYSRVWCAASSRPDAAEVARQASVCFEEFAYWWHQYAAHELESMESEDPLEVYRAAADVAQALKAWHARGESAGDIGFWAPFANKFDSARAYTLVVETLLDHDDLDAALGMLMHWLSHVEEISLEQGETSFSQYCLRWLETSMSETGTSTSGQRRGWRRVRRFLDHLEANAGSYWEIPAFSPDELLNGTRLADSDDEEAEDTQPRGETNQHADFESDDDDDDDEERFGAAYENVVYRDSTDDGIQGNLFDFDTQDEDYLQQTSRPLVDRLIFIDQLAMIWKMLAVAWCGSVTCDKPDTQEPEVRDLMEDALRNAVDHMTRCSQKLRSLLDSVSKYPLGAPTGDPDSMIRYDRLRLLKDSITDQVIGTQVSVLEAQQFLVAAGGVANKPVVNKTKHGSENHCAVELLGALLRGDTQRATQLWPELRQELADQPILYVPLTRGGPARAIVRVKARQKLIQNLLHWLPRTGLLKETYDLIELARLMERRFPNGSGAITEFDDLFEVGCASAVMALIQTLDTYADGNLDQNWLVSLLEDMMEPMLHSWLAHSRTLRLSVLEQVRDEEPWQELVAFITRFGRDLFTQRFFSLGNVRGILHQGVRNWLVRLKEFPADDIYRPLLDALEEDDGLLDMASEKLTLILEAIVESYSEYRDYNGTTTQSDRGDMLYAFLDFLRLRTSYDRIVWNLRPVVLAHQVLASHGCDAAAETWCRSLRLRIQEEAQRHMTRLAEIQKRYAMRLPSISERLSEQFIRPLLIDQLCAQIESAMLSEDVTERDVAFARIQGQAEEFLHEPSGAGLDVPNWLLSMEDEVRSLLNSAGPQFEQLMDDYGLPPTALTVEQFQAQIEAWRTRPET